MDPHTVLTGISPGLRKELLESFAQIVRNFRERRWEPSELNGGKLCEVVYSILSGYVAGSMPNRASKPRNMVDACKALENADSSRFPRSVRIQLPRLLVALYEIRNNRGVGHVGGDVDPNGMDAKLVLEASKWIVAELVRIFHGVSVDVATAAVDKLTERTFPIVWQTGNIKRVLDPSLSAREQTLLLLYASEGKVAEAKLVEWTEYTSAASLRRDVLRKLHQKRLIEFSEVDRFAQLTPLGVDFVEQELPLSV